MEVVKIENYERQNDSAHVGKNFGLRKKIMIEDPPHAPPKRDDCEGYHHYLGGFALLFKSGKEFHKKLFIALDKLRERSIVALFLEERLLVLAYQDIVGSAALSLVNNAERKLFCIKG